MSNSIHYEEQSSDDESDMDMNGSTNSDSDLENSKNDVQYCLKHCNKDVNNLPMIFCEYCENWYHYDCVGLTEQQVEKIEKYRCLKC